jgi:hypothetical protein
MHNTPSRSPKPESKFPVGKRRRLLRPPPTEAINVYIKLKSFIDDAFGETSAVSRGCNVTTNSEGNYAR